ncbi:MAG: hypothetical protein HUU20_16065 [Pirellulales bacterium]|nr:hypothetical protein [Pirellulales bacterium]
MLALIKAVQVQGPQSEGIYIEAADYFTRPNGCWEVEASCEAIATAIEAEISRIEGQPMGGEGRGGASWAARLEAADAQQTTEPTDDLPPDAMLSPATLAAKFDVPLQALQGRLKRWREKHADGWQEVTNRKPREPQYLYRLEAVRPVIEEMRSKAGG